MSIRIISIYRQRWLFQEGEILILKNAIIPSKTKMVAFLILSARKISILAIFLWAVMAYDTTFSQATVENDTDSGTHITGGFESDFASKYVWRGLAFSSGAVTQNSIWISEWGLTGSVWSNYDVGSRVVHPRLNEFDFSLDYESSFHKFDIQSSLQSYVYPDQADAPSTGEFSINLSYGFPILQPFTIQTFDLKAYRGAYFGEFGFKANHDISEKLSADLTIEMGWGSKKFNQAYIGDVGSAIELASSQGELTWSLLKSLYLQPHLGVTTLINRDIRAQVEKATLYQFGAALGGDF